MFSIDRIQLMRNPKQFGMLLLGCAISFGVFLGCAAFHPVDGIPVQGVPAEFRSAPRSGKVPIDLSRLRQTRPPEYRVDTGDVLGIFIEGVLGKPDEVPPVTITNNIESRPALGYPIMVQDDGTISLPGFADLSVRGMTLREIRERIRYAYTVENPLLQKQGEKNNQAVIMVNLQRQRTYRVMVIRQEAETNSNGSGPPSQIDLNVVRRGTGQVVQLKAYENDVLHALTQTGGLPSSQAENAVYILRRRPQTWGVPMMNTPHSMPGPPMPAPMPTPIPTPIYTPTPTPLPQVSQVRSGIAPVGYSLPNSMPSQYSSSPVSPSFSPPMPAFKPQNIGSPYGTYRKQNSATSSQKSYSRPGYTIRGQSPHGPSAMMPGHSVTTMPGADFLGEMGIDNPDIIRIPLRVYPGDQPPFSECDIILQEGDIVFVESRETEFFFTGGLLGGGQYVLPQNYDLDLLEALSIVQSQVNTSFSSATRAVGGVSALNQDVTVGASKVIILRKTASGGEIRIKVDLYDAIRDPRERIIIQPGDYVLLQYTRCEAIAAFLERHILEGVILGGASSALFGNN